MYCKFRRILNNYYSKFNLFHGPSVDLNELDFTWLVSKLLYIKEYFWLIILFSLYSKSTRVHTVPILRTSKTQGPNTKNLHSPDLLSNFFFIHLRTSSTGRGQKLQKDGKGKDG